MNNQSEGPASNAFADPVKLKLGKGNDARSYALYVMPPAKAMFFMPKVAKALSSILNADLSLKDLGEINQENMGEIAKVILSGLQNLDPEALTLLGREALQHEVYGGSKKFYDKQSATWHHFDDWFSSYPQDMMQVMGWAIWENAKPFFPGGSELMDSLVERAKTHAALQSQKDGSQNTKSEES